MRNLLSIVGPTATGKTSLAVLVAQEVLEKELFSGVDIISADSRQVYQGLSVVSGADLPQDLGKEISFHGVAIIAPDQEWSVVHFKRMALPIIENSWEKNRLPIVVGGTGLYHKHLFNPEITKQPAPSLELRAELEKLSLTELQEKLRSLNSKAAEVMNDSDIKNPRRLIRAIERTEIGTSEAKNQDGQLKPDKHLVVGLSASLEKIKQKISQRVLERFKNGSLEEIDKLRQNFELSSPAMTATGVREISSYLDRETTAQECLDNWILSEFQYAKRQLTWFKKEKNIKWFLVDQAGWKETVLDLIVSQFSTSH